MKRYALLRTVIVIWLVLVVAGAGNHFPQRPMGAVSDVHVVTPRPLPDGLTGARHAQIHKNFGSRVALIKMINERNTLALFRAVTPKVVTLACLCFLPAAVRADSGVVRYVQHAGPAWDQFTGSGDPSMQATVRGEVSRVLSYTPYFDSKLAWMPNAWVYFDTYAIYPNSLLASQHPEWIMKDANGNKLFIPWGCSNGTCPQYAGDISNPQFRAYQISQIQSFVAANGAVPYGYKGVYLDDVNLDMTVGNSAGSSVRPIDSQTMKVMTASAWGNYFAQYMEAVRMAVPRPVEIVHNAPWFSGGNQRDQNPYVEREIAAADYINIERGFGDPGLTNGTGSWSVSALMAYIDHVHRMGTSVVIDDGYLVNQMYSLPAYFLIQAGNDGFGIGEQTPETWSGVYSVYLGSPTGSRYNWNGMVRRDFANGFVVINTPGSSTQSVTLPKAVFDTNGNSVTSISLGGKEGGIYLFSQSH